MESLAIKLKERILSELPLWQLKRWQFILLLCWAAWPWLSQWAFPGHPALALGPVVIFLPFAYPVGSVFASAFPGLAAAYELGMSTSIFVFAYLGIVSWRLRLRNK